ncbi:hypothetical protein L1D94_22805 [Vibrio alginolyticus]|uniref:hypothetical protein n=1 Tax=Vibrio TaxID=662 RepID=UPI001EFECC7F|nr:MULTISPECIES: hypothetical protein [Vibrio]MCG9719429.1 hypothetical protein [Vibrio alginolyticus]MDW1872790.1 hypothetical protein [Vibrio sp. Vb0598]
MTPKNIKFIRNTNLKMIFKNQAGINLTQQQFYSILNSPELLAKLQELGVDKDRDKSLIFVVAVLAWIFTGVLSNRVFGVELTGFLAGCFIVFFGNHIIGAFRLGVEQAVLETISELGNDEIKARTVRLNEIENQKDPDEKSTREYWISYVKFRRTTYQYVGLANLVNWVFIISLVWTLWLGAKWIWSAI